LCLYLVLYPQIKNQGGIRGGAKLIRMIKCRHKQAKRGLNRSQVMEKYRDPGIQPMGLAVLLMKVILRQGKMKKRKTMMRVAVHTATLRSLLAMEKRLQVKWMKKRSAKCVVRVMVTRIS